MGSYTFRWEHPAETVYVTGTFDSWSGNTHKLDKEGTVHQKTIALPAGVDKVDYKFVADGVWRHDPTHNTETDETGNINNFITASDIMPATLNSSGPGSTTAGLAGAVPLEKAEQLPGAFPETPAAAGEEQTFSVNPIPATAGAGNPITLAPGEPVPHHSTLTDNTINSTVRDDEALKAAAEPDQTVSVAPIPATSGLGNPITLAPGEPVPHHSTLTDQTLTSNVKLDQASYENSDGNTVAGFGNAAPATESHGLGSTNIIPESSIGMGADAPSGVPVVHSAGGATTADLAGQVPLEDRREAYVIEEGGNAAAGNTQTQSASSGGIVGAIAGGVAGLGAAAAGTAVYLNEKTKQSTGVDAVSKLPESIQSSIKDINSRSGVPAEVASSQQEAAASPEASANPAAVSEKSAVEKELLSKVPTTAPADGSTTAAEIAGVPSEVFASQQKAHVDPEAAANPTAVLEKSALEKELLAKVHTTENAGVPAPTVTAATSAVAPSAAATTDAATAVPATTVADTTTSAPTEHVGIAPNVSAQGAPQLGAVGPHAPISLEEPVAGKNGEEVSPLTTPGTATPRKSTASNSTPNKRQSIIERFKGGSTASSPSQTPVAEASEDASAKKEKRKSLFGRIKEKLQK